MRKDNVPHGWHATAVLVIAVTALLVPWQGHAQTFNKCSAAKKKCVAKYVKALLKCHEKAEKKGLDPSTDPGILACIEKAESKFDGGVDPTRGCFEKIEAKENLDKPETVCLTLDDTTTMRATVARFVTGVVTDLDPSYVPSPRFEDTGLTIIDHKTGLEWEKKNGSDGSPAFGNPTDVDNFYLWKLPEIGPELECDTPPFPNADSCPTGDAFWEFLGALNYSVEFPPFSPTEVVGSLGGHTDWRLPTIVELQTILDLTQGVCGGGSGPCIDPIFGPTRNSIYWSSTSLTDEPDRAWHLNFNGGLVSDSAKTSGGFYVRAVRGSG